MDVQRKSERSNKGIPPTRFGFENYGLDNFLMQNKPEVGAFGDINSTPNYGVENPATQNVREDGAYGGTDPTLIENTTIREKNIMNRSPNYAKSIVSKANSKTSKRNSIREVAHLKKTMEREAEIYEIDMLALKRKKEFLLRAKELENEIKQQEDDISNNGRDEDDEIPEFDDEKRKQNIDEWVNKIESPFRFENMDSPPNNNNRHHQQIFENTRQNQLEYSVQNDVLIAAFKALQTKEIKDLPTFDGDNVLEWPNFISEFRRSTKEFNITPNRNLRRLNKAIIGSARTSIQTLLTSPDNIEQIISHLEMSFGRREWILEHLVLDLQQLPVMKEENIHQSKLFYSKLFGATTTIKNMNAQNYLDTPELLRNLEEKLSPTMKNYWIHYKAELLRRRVKVNIDALGELFKFELDAQFAGLSAKDIINESHTSGWDENYIPDGKEFP